MEDEIFGVEGSPSCTCMTVASATGVNKNPPQYIAAATGAETGTWHSQFWVAWIW